MKFNENFYVKTANVYVHFFTFCIAINNIISFWEIYHFNTIIIQRSIRNICRGSYMSAHVLLNLLNELGRSELRVRLARR